jgi:AbrB family looped-hinge helix DNA binding protein
MVKTVSKVTKAGQITIPKELRRALKLTGDDYVVIERLGNILLVKKMGSTIQDLEAHFEQLAQAKGLTPEKVLDAVKDIRRG